MSGIIKMDTRASSGNMTTSNQYIVYWIECIQNSQSVSNNTSNVTVKVHIKRTNTGYTTYGSGTVYCKINGTTYSASISSSQKITSTAITLFTKTLTISHSSDGTKSLTMSAWVSHSQFSSNEQSYTQTLTTIPRASSISVTSSVEAGKSVTVTINRASSSFTHKVYYSFGSNTATISTSATTSASYTIPISHVNAIPNATSGTATISVDTYNGSTYIGSSSRTFTITVPSSVKPTISSLAATVVENGASTSYGYVKGKSKCNLVINGATGSHGSTIKSYSITGGGFSSSESSFTTGALTSSGNITFTATVTDSRGRKSDAKTVTINVLDYTNPNITSFSCIRCDSDGVADNDGTYLKILATYTYSSLDEGNNVSTKIEYKKTSTSIWINAGSIDSGNYIVTGSNDISTESAYNVRLTITDNLTSISKSVVIPASFITLDFKKGGKGIAIGKISETDNLLDVDVNSKFRKDLNVDGAIFGQNNIALTRALVNVPQDGVGNITSDFIRFGNSVITDNNNHIYFVPYTGSTQPTVHFANKISLGRGTVYLPQGGGNTTTDFLRIGGGFMCGTDSNGFHFLTLGGSAAKLHASNITSTYSIEASTISVDESIFDEINSFNVVNTDEGLRLMRMTKSIDNSKTVSISYDENINKEKINIDHTSAISVLWKAVQELKKENEELKELIQK